MAVKARNGQQALSKYMLKAQVTVPMRDFVVSRLNLTSSGDCLMLLSKRVLPLRQCLQQERQETAEVRTQCGFTYYDGLYSGQRSVSRVNSHPTSDPLLIRSRPVVRLRP